MSIQGQQQQQQISSVTAEEQGDFSDLSGQSIRSKSQIKQHAEKFGPKIKSHRQRASG